MSQVITDHFNIPQDYIECIFALILSYKYPAWFYSIYYVTVRTVYSLMFNMTWYLNIFFSC